MPCHAMPCHAIPCHAIPYHTIPYHTIPYHTIPYPTILGQIGWPRSWAGKWRGHSPNGYHQDRDCSRSGDSDSVLSSHWRCWWSRQRCRQWLMRSQHTTFLRCWETWMPDPGTTTLARTVWFSLMSRIERKYCLLITSFLAGLIDIFILLHIWENCVCFGDFLSIWTLFDAYHKEFESHWRLILDISWFFFGGSTV